MTSMSGAAARSPSHADLLVGTTSESSAAEELAVPTPVPEEAHPREDNQEESGPRIVAFTPEKLEQAEKAEKKSDTTAPAAAKAEKASSPSAKADKVDAKPGKKNKRESVAPAVDLDHESFFEAGEKADKEHRAVARGVLIPHEHEHEEDPRAKHKMSPAVRERRARFTKYVKWAVGASAVVCLAALVRVTVARGQHGMDNLGGGSQAAEISQSPMPAPIPAPLPAPPAAEPTAAQAVAPPPVAADPPVAPTDLAPAPSPPVATDTAPAANAAAVPASDVPSDPAAAKLEKATARKALERGDMKGAIEAGERSVALDPTDGDAWLLLGAAYQEKGKGADARRAFTACLKLGKRGAIGECAAMLR